MSQAFIIPDEDNKFQGEGQAPKIMAVSTFVKDKLMESLFVERICGPGAGCVAISCPDSTIRTAGNIQLGTHRVGGACVLGHSSCLFSLIFQ